MSPTIVPDPPVARRPAPPPGVPLGTAPPPSLGVPIRDAVTRRARLRGLLGHRDPPPFALRLAPCRSVHTFGMRFALDLHWLDASGATVRVDHDVGPGRIRGCRRARAVVEVPVRGGARGGEAIVSARAPPLRRGRASSLEEVVSILRPS